MKENTVYLLYNTNANNVKLQHGLEEDFNREWEYEDREDFTIMYSPDDERKYTDIRILSKTRLKQRPKSADQLRASSVEGVFIRRSNSLSIIEEDLLILRRCPQIRPLLSETKIRKLHVLLEECLKKMQVTDKRESNTSNGLHQPFTDDRNLRNITGDMKGTHLYDSTKGTPSWNTPNAYPQGLDANKTREKAKILPKVTKADNDGKMKSSDKWEKTPVLNSNKLKKGENKNNVTGVSRPSQEVKPKKKNVDGTRSKSENEPKNAKQISKQNKTLANDEDTKAHRKKNSETKSQPEKKTAKKKSKTSLDDEHKEKKQRKPQKDSVKTKKDIDKTTSSKESLSDPDQLSQSSGKTPVSKQKEPKKKIDDSKTKLIKNKDDNDDEKIKLKKTKDDDGQTKLKKDKDNDDDKTKLKKDKDERTPTTEKTEKPEKSRKSKPDVDSKTLSKNEKRSKPSITLSSKQDTKRIKTDKAKTSGEANLAEDLLSKKEEGKSTKPSPSDISKTKDTKTDSENKVKTKDKFSPGTIQYIIHYILSNPIFINLGWTLQPTKKAFSRIVTFNAVPAKPQSYCFRSRDNVEQKLYPSGSVALNISEDGTGRINYPGGTPAIILTRSNSGMRLTLYSCPTKDPLVKESFYTRIIGMFDSLGNGVVYDSNGKKILNFNQMQGIYYNPSRQTPYKWQWSCFKVLEAQRLKELLNTMVNEAKQPVPSSPKGGKAGRATGNSGNSKKSVTETVTSLDKKPVDKLYEAILEELPNPVMHKPKIKIKTHDNAFKSIILKINKEMTLRINGQDSVAVSFSAQTLFYKMELGVRINPESVERVDEMPDGRVESVPSVLGDLLHPSPSLQKLHQLLDPNSVL